MSVWYEEDNTAQEFFKPDPTMPMLLFFKSHPTVPNAQYYRLTPMFYITWYLRYTHFPWSQTDIIFLLPVYCIQLWHHYDIIMRAMKMTFKKNRGCNRNYMPCIWITGYITVNLQISCHVINRITDAIFFLLYNGMSHDVLLMLVKTWSSSPLK